MKTSSHILFGDNRQQLKKLAEELGRDFIGCELNKDYLLDTYARTAQVGMFLGV